MLTVNGQRLSDIMVAPAKGLHYRFGALNLDFEDGSRLEQDYQCVCSDKHKMLTISSCTERGSR
jgi:hypothetical protein